MVKYSGVIVLSVLLCFLLKSCDFKFQDEGFKSTSINSDISKKNEVFIDNYNLSKRFIVVKKDTLEILEAFVEYKYNITHSEEIDKWEGVQLVLVMSEKIPSDFNSTWGIKAKNKYQLTGGTGHRMIHTDLYCSPKLSSCYTILDSINLMIVQDIFSDNEFVKDTILLKRRYSRDKSEKNTSLQLYFLIA